MAHCQFWAWPISSVLPSEPSPLMTYSENSYELPLYGLVQCSESGTKLPVAAAGGLPAG